MYEEERSVYVRGLLKTYKDVKDAITGNLVNVKEQRIFVKVNSVPSWMSSSRNHARWAVRSQHIPAPRSPC